MLYKFWGLFLQYWETFQGNRATHYWQYFSVWCHKSKHCSDESVYTLKYPTHFYAWKRYIREHYVSQFSIWPADSLNTGTQRNREKAVQEECNTCWEWEWWAERKAEGWPTAVGKPTNLRTRECQRETLAKCTSSGLFKSLEILAFLYTASKGNFAF